MVDVECVCLHPGCGKEFSVPVAFIAEGKPVGRAPDLCEPHRLEADERAAAQTVAAQAKAAPRIDVLGLMEKAGGNPWKYGRWTWDGFRDAAQPWQDRARKVAHSWTEAVLGLGDKYAEVQGLYLCGPTGTAKTLLSHLVLRSVLEAGREPGRGVIYDKADTLIDRIQDTYNTKESTWRFVEQRIRTRVWVLDDLGRERASEDAVRRLTTILDEREGRPVFVTSNLTVEALASRHPEMERLKSRFGGYRLVRMDGPDMRFPAGRDAA